MATRRAARKRVFSAFLLCLNLAAPWAFAIETTEAPAVEFTDTVRQISAPSAGEAAQGADERVIFNQQAGVYFIKKGAKGFKKMTEALTKARKKKTPVSVKADSNSLFILGVRPAPKS